MKKTITYKDSGVDIKTGDSTKKNIAKIVKATFSSRVLSEIGLFGGLFDISKTGMNNPVLVSSIDGVGTKIKVAAMTGIHNTVGQDIVAHCANDIVVQGAKPLFFLDYIGCSKLSKNIALQLIKGLVKGCKRAGCALLGGETAEMPGVYQGYEYDLVGVITGIVDRKNILDGKKVRAGDTIIGLPSTGLHTNGYSLARKLFFDIAKMKATEYLPELRETLGEALLKIHRDYSSVVLKLLKKYDIHAMAHITGGGFSGNIPRVLPKNTRAVINRSAWEPLPIFKIIQEIGNVPRDEMYRTFNMGIGMALIVKQSDAEALIRALSAQRLKSVIIGYIEKSPYASAPRLIYSS